MNCLAGECVDQLAMDRFLSLVFDRCKDRIFFTWNDSAGDLRSLLHRTIQQHPNVHLETSMGTRVSFWGAHIELRQTQLFTRVHVNQPNHRFALPYVVGHSKVKHSLWFRSMLLRAVCFCSSVADFQQECIRLELTLLANGYSLPFVNSHLDHFFVHVKTHRAPHSWDQVKYHSFRSECFDCIEQYHKREDDLKKRDRDGHLLRFHYFYEYGPRCAFNGQFEQVWCEYFKQHPLLSTDTSKILLNTRHVPSLNALLVRAASLPPMAR